MSKTSSKSNRMSGVLYVGIGSEHVKEVFFAPDESAHSKRRARNKELWRKVVEENAGLKFAFRHVVDYPLTQEEIDKQFILSSAYNNNEALNIIASETETVTEICHLQLPKKGTLGWIMMQAGVNA